MLKLAPGRLFCLSIFSLKIILSLYLFKTKLRRKNLKNLIDNYFLQTQGDEGHLFKGGRLLKILSLKRGASSKRGAYLKLGANSSIYGKLWH